MEKAFLKRLLWGYKVVATHSGNFHADDVFSVAVVSLFENGRISVVRTRKESDLKKADYVIDVGGIYDPARNRFDHHQKGGAGMRPNGIPFSSFGLVWQKIGPLMVSHDAFVEIDKGLVQGIDAVDCGVDLSRPLYKDVRELGLSEVIASFRPCQKRDDAAFNRSFFHAVSFAKEFFKAFCCHVTLRCQAKKKVQAYLSSRPHPFIAVFNEDFEWDEGIIDDKDVLFVVYPRGAEWRIKSLRKSLESFELRCPFPKDWGGLSGRELSEKSGVKTATFCHNKLFLCAAATKEDAFLLAKKAVENSKPFKGNLKDK